ncbi:hypothetical protein EV426DRAFT_709272 [Tirmania nivea]|nr:hypothetical protein EV426DRAFT_709272 [Tirmania nivea]
MSPKSTEIGIHRQQHGRQEQTRKLAGEQNLGPRRKRKLMFGKLQVGYQNANRGPTNTHAFLEWGNKEGMDIGFVGEPWMDKEGKGTQSHPAFRLGSRSERGKKLVVYWKGHLEARIIKETANLAVVEAGEVLWVGVYANGKWKMAEWDNFLQAIHQVIEDRRAVLIGDWNAHREEWEPGRTRNNKGKRLWDYSLEAGYTLVDIEGPTWERTRIVMQKVVGLT